MRLLGFTASSGANVAGGRGGGAVPGPWGRQLALAGQRSQS